VGTIAAFIDQRANEVHQEQAGCFGLFEVLPDSEAAAALLRAAAEWVGARGMKVLRGPLNFSHDIDCGLLLNNYDDPPIVMTSYNPPYYCAYVEQAGFSKLSDWYAYEIDEASFRQGRTKELPPRLQRALDIARRRSGVTIRKVQLRHFEQELARVQQIYNQAWQGNAGFVPLDDTECQHLARSLKPVIDADLVWMAEDQGQPVGAAITLPDLHQALHRMNGRLLPAGWWYLLRRNAYINRARFFAMGVLPAYRRRGIEAAFYVETFLEGVRKGYQRAELSLVAETNTMMQRIAESLGARCYKTYRVYEKPIAPAFLTPPGNADGKEPPAQ
jgi:GNAT superfamily N-acetyltransferase